jgi:hypothetical protein
MVMKYLLCHCRCLKLRKCLLCFHSSLLLSSARPGKLDAINAYYVFLRISQALTHADPRCAAGGEGAGEDGQGGDDDQPQARACQSELVDELLVEGEGEALGGEGVGDGDAQGQGDQPTDQPQQHTLADEEANNLPGRGAYGAHDADLPPPFQNAQREDAAQADAADQSDDDGHHCQ